MTRSFDDEEAQRRDALYTFPDDAPWGPMRSMFYHIKLHDDKVVDELHWRNAYQQQALRKIEAARQRKYPVDTPPNP